VGNQLTQGTAQTKKGGLPVKESGTPRATNGCPKNKGQRARYIPNQWVGKGGSKKELLLSTKKYSQKR